MKKSLYIEILHSLYIIGIGFKTDITHCFDSYSLEADSIFELQSTTREAKVNEYLKILEFEGHLTKANVKLKRYEDDKVKRWIIGEFEIHASLTPKGHVFIDNYLVNEDARQNIKFQKRIALITLLISVTAIIISSFNFKQEQGFKTEELRPLYKRLKSLEEKRQETSIPKKNQVSFAKDSLHKR